ncbi:MAG: hypothetical protein GXY80_08905 [Syntrophorhabdus aromaticivorans]|uniref:CN hydrolase domain-containing protein n=1 Tax=Syntrophorhabdus aromaticivorans TaxID=328301 RepID=A0A971S0Y5_9BACT|nr:hypothetical protein [Syntrophorhabdus aromaticivorans]
MKLALIQMRTEPVSQHRTTAVRIVELIRKAGEGRPDLIVLPECAYPSYMLYSDPDAWKSAQANTEDLLVRVGRLAAEYSMYIVMGIALTEGDALYNAAVVWDREGREIGRARKSNLWHFDGKWFDAGQTSEVYDTEFGPMGVMVCADGRIPEIAGMLRAKGAKLIVDPVNLVAAAATPEQLSNQQYEFILPARAKENGVFIAVADKCGVEEDMVTCLGRSFVTDPEGKILAECSPDKEEILFVDIDLSECKEIPEKRPALYEAVVTPTEELPVTRDIQAAYTMDELNLYTLLVRYSYASKEEYIEKAMRYLRNGQIASADLIVLPELEEEFRLDDALTETVSKALEGDTVAALAGRIDTGKGPARVVRFLTSKGLLGALQSTHCAGVQNADSIDVLSLTPSIKIAALFDEEAEIPEIARTAMLKGADILLCCDGSSNPMRIRTLKTRAAENSVFVIRSAAAPGVDTSAIYNPAGGQTLTTLTSGEHAAAGYIHTALSKSKSIVPGTHIVHGRIPSFYKKERNHEQ